MVKEDKGAGKRVVIENPDMFKIGLDAIDITQFGYTHVYRRDESVTVDQNDSIQFDLHVSHQNSNNELLNTTTPSISINPHLSNNACSHCQILSINVGGLNKRLQSSDFEECIQNYSIVCIQETHFDHFDSIHIPGFTPLPFMIRDRAKYRS